MLTHVLESITMKKQVINRVRRFLLAASVLISVHAQAQVPITVVKTPGSYGSPTVSSSGDACLTYTAGVADTRVYSFSGVPLNTPTYTWSVQGGLAIVGSATGATVTVKAAPGSKRPYPKGRLTLFYKGTIDSIIPLTSCAWCNGNPPQPAYQLIKVPKSGTIYIDTYQKFDHSEQILGPACVSVYDSVQYSIRDLLTGNPNESIGSDTYFWKPNSPFNTIIFSGGPLYVFADSSAVTYKFSASPSTSTTYSVNVTVGKCNVGGAGKLKTKNLVPKIPAAYTTPDTYYPACISAATTTYTITNYVRPGVTYTWSKSNDTWSYTGGTNAASQAGVTFSVGTQPGNVYLKATSPSGAYCGTAVDTIRIRRSLAGAVISTIPAAACFTKGVAYTFRITPAPGGDMLWIVPAGWVVDPDNLNAASVTITPGASAVSGAILAVGKECMDTTTAFAAGIALAPPVITGTACVARGSSYLFSTPAVAGVTAYNWTFPAGWSWSPLNGSSVTATVGAAGVSGNVKVTAVGCASSSSAAYAVTLFPPKPGTVTLTPSTCVNKGMADTLTCSVTSVAGISYQWVLPAGWSAAASIAPYNTYTVYTNGTAGTYYIKVRARSTCSSVTSYSMYDSVQVAINGIASAVVITNSPVDSDGNGVQDGENLSVGAVAAPAKYQWYNAAGPIAGQTSRFLDLLNAGLPNGTYYIRVAKNGCQTQANTTSNFAYRTGGATASELMAKVNVFPVPASNEITVDLPISYEQASVDIVDMEGVNVLSRILHGKSVDIPLSRVPSGSYYMMFTIDGTTFGKKIVVVK